MRNWLMALVACLALGVLVAGCGSDDDGGNDGSGAAATTEQSTTTGGGGGGAATKTASVSMKDISFQPASVTIAQGGTVTWTNDDSVNHDVTADDGSFKSGSAGNIAGGGTYKHAFAKAGSFKYVCTVHPGMEGTVVVK